VVATLPELIEELVSELLLQSPLLVILLGLSDGEEHLAWFWEDPAAEAIVFRFAKLGDEKLEGWFWWWASRVDELVTEDFVGFVRLLVGVNGRFGLVVVAAGEEEGLAAMADLVVRIEEEEEEGFGDFVLIVLVGVEVRGFAITVVGGALLTRVGVEGRREEAEVCEPGRDKEGDEGRAKATEEGEEETEQEEGWEE
jgi:hypothetical protein